MKDILKRNTYYIIDAIIFIVFLGLAIGSFLFMNSSLLQHTSTQQQIASTLLTYQNNDNTVQQFNTSGISKNSFSDTLPTQNTLINWVEQIETIAKDTSTTESLTFSSGTLTKNSLVIPQTPGSTAPTLGIQMIVKGTYNNILSFIDALNHSYYYTQITGFAFSSNGSNTTTTGLQSTSNPAPTQTSNTNLPVIANITLSLFVNDTSTSQ